MAVGALSSNAFGLMPAPNSHGGVHVMCKGREGSTQSFKAGSPLKRSSGTLVVAGADNTADIVGVSVAAATGTTGAECLYYPAYQGAVFEATLEDETNTNHALVITNLYTDYALQVDSNGIYYADENDTTNTCVTVVGVRKWQDVDDATVRARVLVAFLMDTTIYDT